MAIYSRSGDGGRTENGAGNRIDKTHPQIAAVGELDELNAEIGLCLAAAAAGADDAVAGAIQPIQGDLCELSAMLAKVAATTLEASCVGAVERRIDEAQSKLPPLDKLVLPGGCELACRLHVARGVCRRAERAIVALAASGQAVPETALAYINRLSDLLFVLARLANRNAGCDEQTWGGQAPRPT